MSMAATTVTRLRSVPAGGPAGAVGVGLSTETEGDGSGEADGEARGDGDADPVGWTRRWRLGCRPVRDWVEPMSSGSGSADGSGPGPTDGSGDGRWRRLRLRLGGRFRRRRILGDDRGRDHGSPGQQQCDLQQDDAVEEDSPAAVRRLHLRPLPRAAEAAVAILGHRDLVEERRRRSTMSSPVWLPRLDTILVLHKRSHNSGPGPPRSRPRWRSPRTATFGWDEPGQLRARVTLRRRRPATSQPGSRFPQEPHVESTTRLPKPQFGQRFNPSVDTPYGFSRVAAALSRALPAQDAQGGDDAERRGHDEAEQDGGLVHAGRPPTARARPPRRTP